MNQAILLNKRPVGMPTLNDFKFVNEETAPIKHGEVLLKTVYVSVDPYMRGRMNESKSYVPPYELNKVIESAVIAEIVESMHPDFSLGDFVTGHLGWRQYQMSDGKGLRKIEDNGIKLSAHLGVLGMTGITAYVGLTEIGLPVKDETILISGAAGAVGTIVGQIGKLMGCKVVGITGSDEKVELLTSKFGFDFAINYKKTDHLKEAVRNATPNGVDIYFDNVGGDISDAVLANINKYARLPVCGSISLYNDTVMQLGPRLQPILLTKSATMRGFIVGDFHEKFPAAIKQLTVWLIENNITFSETIVEGFDSIPQAFIDLFTGKNEGKMIVSV